MRPIFILLVIMTYQIAGTTMTEVRLELANEESLDAARGKETLHDVSVARWLTMGLDLEEQQCVFHIHYLLQSLN